MAALTRLWLLPLLCLAAPLEAAETERWRGLIAEAAHRFDLPEEWIERVMRAESDGRTMLAGRPIRSSAGAIGLMQLMPATWAEMRRAHGLGANPDDPRDNILAGAAYLKAMHRQFGYPGLFAAYNAGPGRYREHLAAGRALPAETVAYLASVAPDATRVSPVSRDRLFVIGEQAEPVIGLFAAGGAARSLLVPLSGAAPTP